MKNNQSSYPRCPNIIHLVHPDHILLLNITRQQREDRNMKIRHSWKREWLTDWWGLLFWHTGISLETDVLDTQGTAGVLTEKLNGKSKSASRATKTFMLSQTRKYESMWQQRKQQYKSNKLKLTGYKWFKNSHRVHGKLWQSLWKSLSWLSPGGATKLHSVWTYRRQAEADSRGTWFK